MLVERIEEKKYEIEDSNTIFVEKLKKEDFRIKAPVKTGRLRQQ